MSTMTTVGLSEYLKTSYRPDRDWIDGELRERNMGEGPHSFVQTYLAWLFRQFQKEWQVRGLTEQRVQTSATHFRIPDVSVVSADSPLERIIRTPPLLCVEILSYDDRMSEIQERVADYLAMGVGMVWILDPRRRAAFESTGTGTRMVEILTVPGTPVSVAVAEIFAELEELERLQQ